MWGLVIALQAATVQPIADRWLRDNLKDYDTARIEQIKAPAIGKRTEGGGLLSRKREVYYTFHCLRVNAKNSYGGYTGWTTYMLGEHGGKIALVRYSPYYNEYARREIDNDEVLKVCG
ncbi:MAG: hypothetical protein EOP58_01685 [Sphingomonadales bacterium]|nr:MAG: hypothetical protein EOP58_01685 [Sphingomonadales bacterium]